MHFSLVVALFAAVAAALGATVESPDPRFSGRDSDPKTLPPFGYAYTDQNCQHGQLTLDQSGWGGLLQKKYHSFKPIVNGGIGCSAHVCREGTEAGCQGVGANQCFTSTDPKNLCVNFKNVPCSDQYPC